MDVSDITELHCTVVHPEQRLHCAVTAATGGPAEILRALRAAKAAGEKVLVHCWGGGGRTGLVQAAWLVTDRGLSPQEAADAVTSYGKGHGLSRRVEVEALQEFLAAATAAEQ